MFNFQKILQPKVFGLDLSSPIIKAAQMPNKFAFGSNIGETIKKAGIKTKYVNICLPEKECFVKLIPKNGDIKKEIEANIPLGFQEIYYDFKEIGHNFFIAATKRKIVDKYINQVEKAGLIISAIEPESVAISRGLGKNKTSFLIIKKNKDGLEAVFIIVLFGIIKFTSSSTLDQTSRYLDFYQTANAGNLKIVLCGDGDLEKASQFLKKINLPIEIAPNPSYVAAIGLALKND